jgi:NADPH-dependent ferric siderophore reductase
VHGEVIEVVGLTPTMVLVVLGGDGLERFEPTPFTDQYVNALFIPEGAPYTVPFDLEAARATAPEHRPVGRRYTIRAWDPIERHLAIDFVVHGEATEVRAVRRHLLTGRGIPREGTSISPYWRRQCSCPSNSSASSTGR